MSELIIYSENAQQQLQTKDAHWISHQLESIGVKFEQWQPSQPVKAGDDENVILRAYQHDVQRIVDQYGFLTVDVISVDSNNPNKAALREKFLSEHIHTEDEVRFFVSGCGLFYLHVESRVYSVLCEKGDLISVPANTRHWFDLGPEPDLAAIRFFNNPEGWVAQYTGSEIAKLFPKLDS